MRHDPTLDKADLKALDKADREVVRALQALAKLEGGDHLCVLCLAATSENCLRAWNNKRKKAKKWRKKK